MSMLLILVSFAQFIVLSYLFIVNSFDEADSDLLGWHSGPLRKTWQVFEAIESIAPLFIGWFNLLIITYFAKQVGYAE